MESIILNSQNVQVSQNNNTFVHRFPQSVKYGKNAKIALGSLSIYNSFFNITAEFQNNTFSYTFSNETVNVVIEDGLYSASDLSSFLEFSMKQNNHYMIDSATQAEYFYCEIAENPTRYAIEIVFTNIPTSAEATTLGLSQPVGATWAFPNPSETVSLTINSELSTVLGITQGTYNSYVFSQTTPQINPLQSINVRCNFVSNINSYPSNILYSFPITAGFGSVVNVSPTQFIFAKIAPATYNQIEVTLTNQRFEDIKIRDTDLSILLVIVNEDEE